MLMNKKNILAKCSVCKEPTPCGAYCSNTKRNLCMPCYCELMDREKKREIVREEGWFFGRVYIFCRKIFGGRL